MDRTYLQRKQHAHDSFTLDAYVTQKTLVELQEQGEGLYDTELELLTKSNPCLLDAVAQVANIFPHIEEAIACMQGCLIVYHMISLSLEKSKGSIPKVTEEHMLELVEHMDPQIDTLGEFVMKELTHDQSAQKHFLLQAMGGVYEIFNFAERNLLAFGTGMVMAYTMLRLAEDD